jgi:hypothetical protein
MVRELRHVLSMGSETRRPVRCSESSAPRHALLPEVGGELAPVPALHQRVPHEAQLGLLAFVLLVRPKF